MNRLLIAAEFAANKHAHQRRKGVRAVPYVNHPLAVAALLATVGGVDDEDVLVAALLHDTLEDTDATPAEIQAKFGDVVLGYVMEVTDDSSLPKAERVRLLLQRAPRLSKGAKLIKLADQIHNIRSIIDDPPVGWSDERRAAFIRTKADVFPALAGVHAGLEKLHEEVVRAGLAQIEADRSQDRGWDAAGVARAPR